MTALAETLRRDGHVVARFLKYVSYNVTGMVALSLYIVVDTFFIARVAGADGLAALNFALVPFSIMLALSRLGASGAATRYSLCRGAGNLPGALRYLRAGAVIALAVCALGLLTGPVGADAVSWLLGGRGEVGALAALYMRIVLAFTPAFVLDEMMIFFVRNDGGPRLCMVALVSSSLFNIVGDWLFMMVFGWGIAGGALATGIAPCLSVLILAPHVIGARRRIRRQLASSKTPSAKAVAGPAETAVSTDAPNPFLDFRGMAAVAALGVNPFVLELSSAFLIAMCNFVTLALVGDVGVAAYGVIANVAFVGIALFNGTAQGVQPLVSEAAGAGRVGEVRLLFACAAMFSVALGSLLAALIVANAAPIISLFNSAGDAQLAEIADRGMKVYFLSYPFAAPTIVLGGCLAACGRGRESWTVAFMRGFVAIAVAAAVLVSLFGLLGLWLAFPVGEAVSALVAAVASLVYLAGLRRGTRGAA